MIRECLRIGLMHYSRAIDKVVSLLTRLVNVEKDKK